MRITFLGTGTGLPSRERAPSALLLRPDGDAGGSEGTSMLFDCGSGTIGRLLSAGVDPVQLDILYTTHAHSDHTADLVPLLQAMDLAGRTRDLHWTAPAALGPFLESLLALQPWAAPETFRLIHHAAESEPYSGPGWQVRAAHTGHTPHSVGYRVEAEGHSVVISGDAAYCPDLVELAREADLLVLECSYPDQLAVPNHLSPASAGRIAAEAGAGHLVLTHFYPVCRPDEIVAQARRAFAGKLTLAYDYLEMALQ